MVCHTKQYHNVTYLAIQYKIMIQFYIKWYNIILFDIEYDFVIHIMQHCNIQYVTISYFIILHDTILYHVIQFNIFILQFRVRWFNLIPKYILQNCFIWHNIEGVIFLNNWIKFTSDEQDVATYSIVFYYHSKFFLHFKN